MRHPIVEEELAILGEVNTRLDTAGTRREPSEASILEELEHIRSSLATAKAEDRAALLQQWDRQSALLGQLRSARGTPSLDLASPYFAHFQLLESSQRHDILLGKTTRMLPGLPIVDWRNAPISRIFYRYRQGEEYEEEIAGRERSGVVAARRTVVIRERRLERVESPEGVFRALGGAAGEWQQNPTESPRLAGGQGAAIRARVIHAGEHAHLGTGAEGEPGRDPGAGGISADADASPGFRRRADKHLPEIAGLIDGEQFALITRPSSGVVVIRGTAGSGKTTVALHRIAYLAYDDPAIDSAQTLFVVFSTALRDYVGHVLPGLEVRNVQVRTFQDWAAEQLRRLFPRLPRRIREITPAIVTRLKLHPILLVALQQHIRSTDRQPGLSDADQAIDDWASTLARVELLEALFARSAPGAFSADELRRASLWCRDRHEEISAWVAGRASVDAELDAEDPPLLLRAWQLRVGPLPGGAGRPLRYRHVAIDEVQDFSPLEVQVLMDCLDQRRSLTLAGDTQQHILEEGGFSSWTEFLAQLGIAADEVSTLRVSYRCSREIAEFALAVLGELREDDPPLTVRSGPPVELFRFTDHGACAAFLADALRDLADAEPLASVAILTPSPELSALYARALGASEVPRLRRVERQDFAFAPGIEITEIDQVKGLEFDYVVLVEVSSVSYPDTPAARRKLHVGATRPVHQLWLTSVGTPAVAVRAQIRERR